MSTPRFIEILRGRGIETERRTQFSKPRPARTTSPLSAFSKALFIKLGKPRPQGGGRVIWLCLNILAKGILEYWSVGVKQLKIDNCRLKIEMKILFRILPRFLMDKQSKIVNRKSKILMAPLLQYFTTETS